MLTPLSLPSILRPWQRSRPGPCRSAAIAAAIAGMISPAGAQSTNWISQFGTSELETGTQVAVDGQGGAFTATNSGPQIFGTTDVILAQHDATGQLLWTRTIGTNARDEAWDARGDDAGGFLACGSTSGDFGGPSAGSFDAWIGRFDASGAELWLTQIGSDAFDACYGVVPDGTGGAFACGSTAGSIAGAPSGGGDAWIARLDATGSVTWIRQLTSPFQDDATDIVADGTGGFYACGSAQGTLFGVGGGDDDPWVARFTGAGDTVWGRQWGSIDSERSVRLALNGSDGVFVAGDTNGVLGISNAGGRDVWLTRFSADGNQTWIRQFGTSEGELLVAAAGDLAGGLYLFGTTTGVLGNTPAGGLDPWVARYSGAGEQSWLRQFGTAGIDRAGGLAVPRPGQLLLAGSTSLTLGGANSGQEDAWVANFDSLIAAPYCSSPANSTGTPAAISAVGSSAIQLNRLDLQCASLPLFTFGYFVLSTEQGFVQNPAGSQGNLCLSGSIGRFIGPGEIQNSGSTGTIALAVDPRDLPQPLGAVSAQPGETWNFQAWFRDANPSATSNFSGGVGITFY